MKYYRLKNVNFLFIIFLQQSLLTISEEFFKKRDILIHSNLFNYLINWLGKIVSLQDLVCSPTLALMRYSEMQLFKLLTFSCTSSVNMKRASEIEKTELS